MEKNGISVLKGRQDSVNLAIIHIRPSVSGILVPKDDSVSAAQTQVASETEYAPGRTEKHGVYAFTTTINIIDIRPGGKFPTVAMGKRVIPYCVSFFQDP